MARLFGKIDSDIRLGVGCRGHTKITSKTLFSHTGKNEEDGGVIVDAVWALDKVTMWVFVREGGHDRQIAIVTFKNEKEAEIEVDQFDHNGVKTE